MKHSPLLFWTSVAGVLGGVVILDLLTKTWAVEQGKVVSQNQGISFGLFPQLEQWWMVIALLALAALIWWGWENWRQIPWAIGLVMGGGLANVVDRIISGGVRDWLPVPFLGVYNNLADWAIFFSLLWFFSARFERQK